MSERTSYKDPLIVIFLNVALYAILEFLAVSFYSEIPFQDKSTVVSTIFLVAFLINGVSAAFFRDNVLIYFLASIIAGLMMVSYGVISVLLFDIDLKDVDMIVVFIIGVVNFIILTVFFRFCLSRLRKDT